MRVSVFGLGYVGSVSAACLARDGHTVVGVDVNPGKVQAVQSGLSPVIEKGLDALMEEVVSGGRLSATTDVRFAIGNTDVSLVCVGTPSNGNGSLDLKFVEKVCREIGTSLQAKPEYHVVIIRSTVLPGTVRQRLIPLLEEYSGLRAGADFGVCMNPEFLREGTAIEDYYHPGTIVVGEYDSRSGDAVAPLYQSIEASTFRVPLETAEMVKYVNNAFHALKIAFANEVANLAAAHGVEGAQVMEIFIQDHRLNISPAYLRPGFAFGGSCLPKDLRALTYRAKELDLDCPVLSAVLPSNRRQIQQGIELVERTGRKRIGVLGLSFKSGTDDVRESPSVPLVETLVGRGFRVSLYDEKVNPERLIGANKSYLERELPHIASLMCSSVKEVVDQSEVVVIANGSAAFKMVPQMLRDDQILIDLVGLTRGAARLGIEPSMAPVQDRKVA